MTNILLNATARTHEYEPLNLQIKLLQFTSIYFNLQFKLLKILTKIDVRSFREKQAELEAKATS